jgi:hypothetical protein
MLKAAFPQAMLTASEVDPEPVEFCEVTFGGQRGALEQ